MAVAIEQIMGEDAVPGAGAKAPSVELQNVRVAYRSYRERPTSLKESVIRFLKHGQMKHYSTFDALSDLSFTIYPGETVGFIGSNGAGKSTLLKVLAGVLRPSEGVVKVKGRVASLIELGVGFDYELNAIENIYLNGALHRKSAAEIKDRIDHILDFSEIREFATTPIKYYSSGMAARLGFACAIDIDPDVLLVDEILAVGDERFQNKCNGVFEGFYKRGKTVVLVSHDMGMIQTRCSRVGVMSRGKLIYMGDPESAIKIYRDEHYQTVLGQ